MTARAAVFFRVTGRVQGVGFRASTARKARTLGLEGSARNCADGSVEVLAAGSREALDRLGQWLQHGPPLAVVARVETLPVEAAEVPAGFALG